MKAERTPPPNLASEARLPMRAVVRLTGLTADTVRVWERRHAAITPARTEGNARRYTEAQVRRLSLLRAAVACGHTIGELAALSDELLVKLGRTERSVPGGDAFEGLRDEILDAIERFDARASELALARAAASLPQRALALELLIPVLREIGERWHAGTMTIAHEHLATQQVRALVETLLRSHSLAPGAPRMIFCAPEGHLHDAGLLCAALLTAHRGIEPVVLGANLPLDEARAAAHRTRASVIVIACARDLVGPEQQRLPRQLASLSQRHEVWLGVPEGHALARSPGGARVLTSLEAFDIALAARFATTG